MMLSAAASPVMGAIGSLRGQSRGKSRRHGRATNSRRRSSGSTTTTVALFDPLDDNVFQLVANHGDDIDNFVDNFAVQWGSTASPKLVMKAALATMVGFFARAPAAVDTAPAGATLDSDAAATPRSPASTSTASTSTVNNVVLSSKATRHRLVRDNARRASLRASATAAAARSDALCQRLDEARAAAAAAEAEWLRPADAADPVPVGGASRDCADASMGNSLVDAEAEGENSVKGRTDPNVA